MKPANLRDEVEKILGLDSEEIRKKLAGMTLYPENLSGLDEYDKKVDSLLHLIASEKKKMAGELREAIVMVAVDDLNDSSAPGNTREAQAFHVAIDAFDTAASLLTNE